MATRDDAGNIQVDFVWGNMPLQPDDDRGGEGQSATLDYNLDNHAIAIDGWANFPQFIPNYSGDEDSGLETVTPDVRGLNYEAATDALRLANLDWNTNWITPVITAISTVDKVATITLDDVYAFNNGDIISGYYDDDNGVSGTFIDAKITAVVDNVLTVTLKTAIDPALDISSTINSTLFANYEANVEKRYVLSQNVPAGQIVDEGTTVDLAVLQNND